MSLISLCCVLRIVKFSDEHNAIILLNSLPETYRVVINAISYGISELSLEIAISAL